ncbi:ead/Ea22-like family protein [Escherichia coli D10:H20]
MSKIDYQALRKAAQLATQGEWVAFISSGTGTYAVHTPGDKRCEDVIKWAGFDGKNNAENNARYIAAFNPEVVQALLDERERNQQYIKRRDQENEDIALTVGKLRVELEGKDSKIANLTAERDALREGEMGDARHSNTRAAADIYFQLVEECEIPAGGSLVEYVDDMREKLEAAENNLIDSECHVAELEEALRDKQALLEASEKRIAELEAELVSQTYKLNELSGNSPVTPDGWISCSERMPDTKTAVLVAVEFDRKGDWRMKWATYIPGHPDANDGWIIPGASWKPSHWMPLPEPPL